MKTQDEIYAAWKEFIFHINEKKKLPGRGLIKRSTDKMFLILKVHKSDACKLTDSTRFIHIIVHLHSIIISMLHLFWFYCKCSTNSLCLSVYLQDA